MYHQLVILGGMFFFKRVMSQPTLSNNTLMTIKKMEESKLCFQQPSHPMSNPHPWNVPPHN